MKRFLSLFVATAMIFSVILPVSAFADAKTLTSYSSEYYENFNLSNEPPESVTTGSGACSVETESDIRYKNALKLSTVKGGGEWPSWNIPFVKPVSLNGDGSFYTETEFDIKPFGFKDIVSLGKNSDVKFFLSNGNQKPVGLKFHTNGSVIIFRDSDSKDLLTLKNKAYTSDWNNIKIITHTYLNGDERIQEISGIYINGTESLKEANGGAGYPFIEAAENMTKILIKTNKNYREYDFEFGAYVDNIAVNTYASDDGISPVPDMYSFKKAVLEYENDYNALIEQGTAESELAAVKTAVDEAKLLFDGIYEKSEISAAREKIAKAFYTYKSGPDAAEYAKSYDFESENSQNGFKSMLDGKISFSKDNGTYGIDGYATTGESAFYLFETPLKRDFANMENSCLELEFDMRVSGEFTPKTDEQAKNAAVAITEVQGKNKDEARYLTGVKFGKTDNKISTWWSNKQLGTWEKSKWYRIKLITGLNKNLDISQKAKTKIYINGEYAGEFEDAQTNSKDDNSPIKIINGFRICVAYGRIDFDNFSTRVYKEAEKPAEKGALIKALRDFNGLYGADVSYYENAKSLFEEAETVYKNSAATEAQIADALTKLSSASGIMAEKMKELEKLAKQAVEIKIPGKGVAAENVVLPLALHYGSQQGDVLFDEIFLNGSCNKDFSDVYFVDRNGNRLSSEIKSTGNYDFIKDKNLGGSYEVLHLSSGKLVSTRDGFVAFSEDNAASWSKTGFKGNISFVDRNDNIYYNVTKPVKDSEGNVTLKAGIYKLSASDGYAENKLVIDMSDVFDDATYNRLQEELSGDPRLPSYLKKTASDVNADSSNCAQDDDGYIYIGRYSTEWTGTKLYVSDETGENFKCVDWRLDKQHNHTISVNREVYPNEVYVTYDDTTHSPLCQRTLTHAGYDEIKGKADYDDASYVQVAALAKKHFEQVPIPYQNADYFGYFGRINKDGGEYTSSDNVYGIGCGEANILGGPSIYKTKSIMDENAYYPIIETTQGMRKIKSPVEGVLVGGLLSGRTAQTNQILISYDDGESWNAAYDKGVVYSGAAGNGPGRFFTDYFKPMGADEPQMIANGYGIDFGLRMMFGGDKHYAVCYVQLDKLAENGDRIYLKIDGDKKDNSDYDYRLKDITKKYGGLNSVFAEKLDINAPMITVGGAEYKSGGVLKEAKLADIYGGKVKLELLAEQNGYSKIFAFSNREKLSPINIKTAEQTDFAEKLDLKPVLHLKLNEGEGDTVFESVSGRELKIDGGFEWIKTDIRYGSAVPVKNRSDYALRLGNGSSINLGEIEKLKNIDFSNGGSITIAFWTNTEVKGHNESYTEAPEHLSKSNGNIRCGNKFSNQDNHVILHNANFDFIMKYNNVSFSGKNVSSETARVAQPLLDTDYYNLYFVVIKGTPDGTLMMTYGNDQPAAVSGGTVALANSGGIKFDGDLYLGVPGNINPWGAEYKNISNLGIADVMIFDRELDMSERLELYHGMKYFGSIGE